MIMKIMEKLRHLNAAVVYRYLQFTNNTITKDTRFMEVYWKRCRESRMILSIREAYNLYYHLEATQSLGGAVAELGVYKGGGAKLISSFKADRPLYLFDTFSGMPDVDATLDVHQKGDFADTTLTNVKDYLKDESDICFCPGYFPDSTQSVSDALEFSFVHLDADIYESTLSGLTYFYPRLKPGGVIISHDYHAISCPGVKKAVDTFFFDKHESVIPLWDTQCLIIKDGD